MEQVFSNGYLNKDLNSAATEQTDAIRADACDYHDQLGVIGFDAHLLTITGDTPSSGRLPVLTSVRLAIRLFLD